MSLPKLSIKDQMFSHAFSTSNWFKPTCFEWDFNNLHNDFIFFTDRNVSDVYDEKFKNYKKYAWLIESQAVTPESYDFVEKNYNLFDKIFTHSEQLLNKKNSFVVPIGGCHLEENEIGLHHIKNKLISMIYSNKQFADGHYIRHEIAKKYSHLIEIMGSGVDGVHVKKIKSCEDYMFSIVIENFSNGFYFTEKIIDCFLSGVIPIYWGSPHINSFFDSNGIIKFNDLTELEDIIKDKDKLSEFYNKNLKAIKNNFETAKQFKIGEDYLYNKYKHIL
jgi:hypothetical protein